MMKADFHSHLGTIEYNWAGKLTKIYKGDPIKTIFQHYNEGNQVVAITTENARKSCIYIKFFKKFFEEFKNLSLLPAEEIYTCDGELLILYPEDTKPEGIGHVEKHVYEAGFIEKIDKAKEQDAVVILPHAFYDFQSFLDKETNICIGLSIFDEKLNLKEKYKDFFSRVDAIEVFNGLACLFYPYPIVKKSSLEPIKKALKICKMYDKAMLGNSDSHSPEFVGTAYTLIKDDPIKSIKNNWTYPQLNFKKYFDFRTFSSQAIYHYQNKELSKIFKILIQNLISHIG